MMVVKKAHSILEPATIVMWSILLRFSPSKLRQSLLACM